MIATRYRTGAAVVAFAMLAVSAVAAQDQTTVSRDTSVLNRDTVELTRAEIQARRQEIVQQLMELTPEQSERFWPVYRDYRNGIAKVNDEKVSLATKYLNNYDTMSDRDAEDLLKEWFKLREEHLDVQEDYVGRFRKVLPAQKVARFYQIENALDAIVSANLQANLPIMP